MLEVMAGLHPGPYDIADAVPGSGCRGGDLKA